jgi:outer membrane protein OmpA-like peptidoglycan-associated protein
MPTGATAATRSCRDNSSGAETTNCAEGTCTEFCKITACDTAAGYILKDGTCESQVGKPCTTEQLPENAVAGTQRENNGKIECVISECANGFEVRPDKLSCAPKMVLSPEQYQDEIAELADNAQKMHERETSLENRILGAAGIGATGIGGTMIGGALAERRADDAAERAMRAYLETFRCDYGNGTNVKGGETNVELPGGNDMIGLYTEYAQLANDLKIRKEALGLRPGIESEVVIDKAETGLYEYSNNGITGGTYASIARALLNPDGEDAKMWAAQRAATDSKLKTGAIVAGVGTVGSLAGNIAINHGKGNNAKEIIARYEKLRAPLAAAAEHANTPYTPGDNSLDCSRFTGTTGVGKSPNCVCADPTNTRFNYDRGGCVPCESNKVYNQNDECVCPSATPRWNDATNRCESEPTVCLLANKLKHSTKCECVENASAPDGKNCQCKTDEGFEEKDGQCVQKEVPPEHESGSEIGKFSFSADALFASSRWEIKSDKLTQLRSDLANAKQTAEKEKIDLNADDYCVVVVGKTDRTQYPQNSSMNNTKLSLYRANAIKDELKTVFKESNILTYGIAAKDCPKTKYPKANTADCRRVDVTWLAGSCEDNKNNTTNWISNVAEATDAISELQSLLKK